MVFRVEVIRKCTRDFIGLRGDDVQGFARCFFLRRKFYFAFLGQKDQDLLVLETSVTDPALDKGGLAAVEKPCEKIKQSFFHINIRSFVSIRRHYITDDADRLSMVKYLNMD